MDENEITLLAKSGTDEPYTVAFKRYGEKMTVTCSCPEGRHGEFCEHKFRLASNDIMMLHHPGQNSAMLNAHIWVIDSPLSDVLLDLLHQLGEENPDEDAIGKLKHQIGRMMREGVVTNM